MAMKSDFRKVDKDKTCWKHMYRMAASLTMGNLLAVLWSVKEVAEAIFVPDCFIPEVTGD